MTIEEMNATIQRYCEEVYDGNDECKDCAIEKLCAKVCGRFVENEGACRAAYEAITFSKGSMVDHPSHYNQGKFECIDVMVETFGIEAAKNFCLLNAFKYIWRTGEKNGREDIEKAIWYLNKYLEVSK